MEASHKRIISITLTLAVIGGLIALFVYNSLNTTIETSAWNTQMSIGDASTAKLHYVMYTDIFCPYCDKFSDAVMSHWDEFKTDYIEGKNILFEIRVTDMNYESGHSNNSRPAGEGAYCAAKQEKFWEYYHGILGKLYEDYHSKGIGISKTSEHIPDLENSYFYEAAEEAGLDKDAFVSCMENHETADELDKNTRRASGIVGGGVPYFNFGSFKTSGFAGNFNAEYDWNQAKSMLDAGLAGQK